MGARGEIVQTRAPFGTNGCVGAPPAAWLMGYVRTDAPGYREVVVDGGIVLAGAGDIRIDQLSIFPVTVFEGLFLEVVYADDPTTLAFPDRLGWLLGFGTEAGSAAPPKRAIFGGFSLFAAIHIAPGGIPLIGATWTQVEAEADRRILVDRHRRNQGYVWGGAGLFRCRLTMHRYAFEALQTGWCLRGKVTLGGSAKLDTPWTTSAPDGAITGHVLGVDSVEWMGPAQQHAVVTMTIATS